MNIIDYTHYEKLENLIFQDDTKKHNLKITIMLF